MNKNKNKTSYSPKSPKISVKNESNDFYKNLLRTPPIPLGILKMPKKVSSAIRTRCHANATR